MEFCCSGLLGAAESAGRRPEREAPAAAGGEAPVPVSSAPHRWALRRAGAGARWGGGRGGTCGAAGETRPGVHDGDLASHCGRKGWGGSLSPAPAPVKVPGTQPTPFLPLSSGPPRHVETCLSARQLRLAAASPSQTHSNSHLPLICISSLASVGLVSLNLFLSPEPS